MSLNNRLVHLPEPRSFYCVDELHLSRLPWDDEKWDPFVDLAIRALAPVVSILTQFEKEALEHAHPQEVERIGRALCVGYSTLGAATFEM